MPVDCILHPRTGERLTKEAAPEALDQEGVLPAEVTRAALADEEKHSRAKTTFGPSTADPETTCRREVVLKRFLPYDLNPAIRWPAMEGEAIHTVFAGVDDGWEREIWVPQESTPETKDIDGRPYLEVLPGWWARGKVDALRGNTIRDIKTSGYRWHGTPPWKGGAPRDYGDREAVGSWAIQLNCYAEMVERTRGTRIENLEVWRIYRGSQNPDVTFRKFAIPRWPKERLATKIGEHVRTLSGFLQEVAGAENVEAAVGLVPLDGKEHRMFNDKKCSKYCSVRDQCYALAGLARF